MLIVVIILIAIMCSGMTACGKNEFYQNYCSQKNTTTVNAIFSVLIFLSHAVSYVELNNIFDEPYLGIRKFLSQGVVVTYLFYSGYGIMTSINKKGHDYVKSLPINRLFKTWLHFAIIIVMFIVVALATGKDYDIGRYLIAFTGLRSIGNSCWYMFVTFALYIIVYLGFIFFKKSKKLGLIATVLLTIGFVYIEKNIMKLDVIFYDTILCFPLGMLYAVLKPYIDKILMKNDIVWTIALCGIFTVFMYFSQNRRESLNHLILFYALIPLLITVLMMKVNIKSSILDWFGSHIFSFFMLQRIPMLLLQHFGLNHNSYFFIAVSFFATVALSTIFDECMAKLDNIIFKKKIKA